ncbi:MAG: Xaa-Pro peptidase family protein [Candidatus Aminicenantes bacterium]|nr:Xaa-Pro peptidase family protein [Candidatus Aminicenantes bacterium]
MNRRLRLVGWAAGLLVLAGPLTAALTFEPGEYAARRARFMEKIPDGAAVFLGASAPASDVAFRQGHDFAYLTGAPVPNAFLVVDGLRKESVLFFTMTEADAQSEGIPRDFVRDPKAFTGVERVLPADQFGPFLAGLGQRTKILYAMYKPEEIGPENATEKFNSLQRSMTLNLWDGRLTRELQFVKQLRDKLPQVEIRDGAPLVWELRQIKSPAELAVLRQAARIGVKAHRALIQSTRPGVPEKSLAAVFEFVCGLEGAAGQAYRPIIMSGKNPAYGHYHAYDRILQAGDFVILDAGPDYADYHVDISTSFPASGSFSARQKELYEVALAVHDTCLANYRPGVSFKQVGEKVAAMLKDKGLDAYAKDFAGIVRYGGYNHMIGLATHDVTGLFAGPDEILAPGMVFACDIQLFRLEEEIGIRIEDTVAITESGCENLSLGVPRTVAEIEALMREDGILQTIRKKPLY